MYPTRGINKILSIKKSDVRVYVKLGKEKYTNS